jgi:hypothetical protein
MMITDCSKNYLDNTLTLVFEGDSVSEQEVRDYCQRNYNVLPVTIDIEPPNEGFGGYPNPGVVKVQLPWD